MIKTKDFVDAVQSVLYSELPDVLYYTDFMPKDFTRPAVFVGFDEFEKVEQLTTTIIQGEAHLEIIYFAEVNEHSRPDRMGIYDVLDRFREAFSSGKININGMDFDLEFVPAGYAEKTAFADIKIEFMDDTSAEAEEDESIQVMKEIRIKKGG